MQKRTQSARMETKILTRFVRSRWHGGGAAASRTTRRGWVWPLTALATMRWSWSIFPPSTSSRDRARTSGHHGFLRLTGRSPTPSGATTPSMRLCGTAAAPEAVRRDFPGSPRAELDRCRTHTFATRLLKSILATSSPTARLADLIAQFHFPSRINFFGRFVIGGCDDQEPSATFASARRFRPHSLAAGRAIQRPIPLPDRQGVGA